MNVCQISVSEVTYETAKYASGTSTSKEDTSFKDLLKDKSVKLNSNKENPDKVNTDNGQAVKSPKGKEDKSDNEGSSADGNASSENTAASQIAGMLFNQNGAIAQADDAAETGFVQSGIMPLNIVSSESGSQALETQKVFVYTVDSLGVHSLKGNQVSGENLKVNDSQTNTSNSQEILTAADVKKDSVVFAADEKSSELNENGSQKSSGKQVINSESKFTDEAIDDLKELNPFVFEPKEGTVSIKVGEPAETKSWETAAGDIGKAVVESVKDNKIEKLNISLNPKELGEIKVEFVMDNDGISVSFVCSNEKTKKLLADNTDTLSKIIQSNLKQDTAVNVTYSEKSSRQESNSNSSNENFDGKGNNGGYKDGSNHVVV